MTKALFVFAFILIPFKAHAYEEVLEVARSSATVGRVNCSSGTATRIDSQVVYGVMGNGLNRHGVRVVNQDSSNAVYLGFDSQVSTDTASAYLGEKISAGANAPYPIGNGIALWCKAPDAATTGVILSVMQTGFK